MYTKIISINDEAKRIFSKTFKIEEENILNLGFSVPKARLVFWKHPSIFDENIDLNTIKSPTEKEYNNAKKQAIEQVKQNKEELGEVESSNLLNVFDAIKMILEDAMFSYEQLSKHNTNATTKLILMGRNVISKLLDKNKDDIEETLCLLLKELGVEHFQENFDKFIEEQGKEGAFVLVSNKFPFSSGHVVGDPTKGIIGFIGINSCSLTKTAHPVLLAKNKGVPVVKLTEGKDLLIDNKTFISFSKEKGQLFLILNPTEKEVELVANDRNEQINQLKNQRTVLIVAPNKTTDDKEFILNTNIGSMEDISPLKEAGLFKNNSPVGIGLVRTELLYGSNVHKYEYLLNTDSQVDVFFQLFNEIDKSVPIRIRLLDQDASKLTGLNTNKRGQNLMAFNEDVYRAQIRAILRAAYNSGRENVQILLPMVNSVEHVEKAREYVLQEKSNLDFFGKINVQVYAMIEDVQVLRDEKLLEDILDCVDGISLGTNDFGQSIGQDRLKQETLVPYNPLELFMYKGVLSLAVKENKEPCVCGGLANDPNWAFMFTALGASISSSPHDIHIVKQSLVNNKFSNFDKLLEEIKSNEKVKNLLKFIKKQMEVIDNVETSEQWEERFLNSSFLIAEFYKKVEAFSDRDKIIFRDLLMEASKQVEIEFKKIQEEFLR